MRKLIILLVFGLLSCHKKELVERTPQLNNTTFDTILPFEYFPVYPGSFWVYNNGDTLKVSDKYEVYVYNSESFDADPKYDTVIASKLILNGFYNSPDSFAFVNQYSISKAKNSNYRDLAFKGILSTNENAQFILSGAVQGHQLVGKTIKKDTTIKIAQSIYSDVIITIQYDRACIIAGNTPEYCATIKEYYAKNIGLIKRERKNNSNTSFVTDFEIGYYEIH